MKQTKKKIDVKAIKEKIDRENKEAHINVLMKCYDLTREEVIAYIKHYEHRDI